MLQKTKTSCIPVVFAVLFASPVQAIPEWRGGTIQTVYSDPSDIVFAINGAPGPCGSSFYHIKRTNENFKEFYGLVLTAFATGKNVNVYISGCASDRNILSHGNVTN